MSGKDVKIPFADPDRGRLPVLEGDGPLAHYENDVKNRVWLMRKWLRTFEEAEGGLLKIARSYTKYGLNALPNNDIEFCEWAPGAKSCSIFGDFNGWNREEFRCQKGPFG